MSIGLAIILVALTSLAVGLLLLPMLLRRNGEAGREAYNLAVYRDQMAEMERDAGRGLLNAEQVEATRAEIGRRILALGAGDCGVVAHPKFAAAATVAILMLPIASLLIYAGLGSPGLPDRPFADRATTDTNPAAASADHTDMREALAKLRAHLTAHPDDLEGWLLLGRSELGLDHYDAGVEAYRRAVDLSGHRADIVAAWGEAQVLAAGGTVTPAAQEAFDAARKDPEAAPRARYYLALAQMQQGDTAGALKSWRALAADSPSDAAWLPVVRQRIAEASARLAPGQAPASPATSSAIPPASATAGLPSPEAVAAAQRATAGLSAEQRQTMIEAMVARLAARLDQQPNDVDGWAQLGRSYMVLNQPDKARDAFAHALKLQPNDTALKQALAEAESAVAAKPAASPSSASAPAGQK